MKPTADQVWQAYLTANREDLYDTPLRKAIRHFIRGSVEALDGHLEELVTFHTIESAKSVFLRYCINNNYGSALSGIIGLGNDKDGTNADIINSILELQIEQHEPLPENITTMCKEIGMTEEELLVDCFEMNADNLRKWRADTLTIGELLLTQPNIILSSENCD